MTDVELLRRAAVLMRERAQAATPGPWAVAPNCSIDGATRRVIASVAARELWPTAEDAEHIGSWHPAVALAVADLLDQVAWLGKLSPELLHRVGMPEAVAIARAYLGETS